MSNLRLENGEDYPEAAAKHLEDAAELHRNERHDNAAYLAGYVIECSMKTLIQIEQGETPWVHDLDQLSRRARELAALPGAATARYASAHTGGHPIYDYRGAGWRESLRYQPPGSVGEADAAAWLDEAERVYDRVVVTLRLDGVVS